MAECTMSVNIRDNSSEEKAKLNKCDECTPESCMITVDITNCSMKTIPHPRTTNYQQIYTAISKQRVPNSCLNNFRWTKIGRIQPDCWVWAGVHVEPPNCVVFQEQIRFVRLNFRCITGDETEIYTHFFQLGVPGRHS